MSTLPATTKAMQLYLPREEHRRLKLEAVERETTMNELIREALQLRRRLQAEQNGPGEPSR
jgi:hypothetical protein